MLSRQLGPIASRWEDAYNQASQLGYNAIHFTPIQKYGQSNSHYSIADQTTVDDYFFTDLDSEHTAGVSLTLNTHYRLSALKEKVDYCRKEFGVLGIIDIVLNHTADNSPWLLEHPESAYNTKDCPHLYSAYVLDRALADFSDDFANRRNTGDCPSAPYINNEGDLKAVLKAIENRVFNQLNLHEYFIIDIEKTLQDLRKVMKEMPKS